MLRTPGAGTAPPASSPAPGFADTFTRPSSTGDIGPTEDGGRPWRLYGSALHGLDGHLFIQSGKLGLGGVKSNRVVGYVDAGINDGVFKFDLPNYVSGQSPWTVLRMSDQNNLLYLTGVSGADGRWALWRRQGASFAAAIIGTATDTMWPGDYVEVTLAVSSITVNINGIDPITVTEAAQQTATQFGVCVRGSNTDLNRTRWDNIEMLSAA